MGGTLYEWFYYSSIIRLLLAYEMCEKTKNYTWAQEHIQICHQHLCALVAANCKEPLFLSTVPVLMHATEVVEALILLAAGHFDKALQKSREISPIAPLKSKQDKAGLLGVKAALHLQYGTTGHRLALEFAKQARDVDPDQAEWWFLVGNAMGRIRRIENGVVSMDEMSAIEKAFVLQKDASYTVHLAQLYGEYSSNLFYSSKLEASNTYARKAVERYKEAIELRPNCANLKARVAHGMLRIRCKEVMDIGYAKRLMDEVVKMTPNNSMVYHDLGLYYEKFENNTEKGIFNLQKANELGNIKALTAAISIKWKNGLENQIIHDLEEGLARYKGEENQAELLTKLGASRLLINNDWPSAVTCFTKSLQVSPSGIYMERFQGFNGKRFNLLALITTHLRRNPDSKHFEVFQTFLNLVEEIKLQMDVTPYNFEHWKRAEIKAKYCKNMRNTK